jgi:methylmalonyl-CoA epimerase
LILRLHHIAIACKDIKEPLQFFKKLLNREAEEFVLEDRGIRGAFIRLGDIYLELISPIKENTAISKFLEKSGGGLHHISIVVEDLNGFLNKVKEMGIKIVDGPRPGAHGGKVAFLDPKKTHRVLIEVMEE